MSYTKETCEMKIYSTIKYCDLFWALLKNTVLMKDSVGVDCMSMGDKSCRFVGLMIDAVHLRLEVCKG